jgi:hypothetical protein
MAVVTPYSAINLVREVGVDPGKWNRIPDDQVVAAAADNMVRRGMEVIRVENGDLALKKIMEIIPPGSEVMSGSSTTLIEVGFDALIREGSGRWKSLHSAITAENDAGKRADLRRKSVCAEYFVSSANAIAESGELVAWDATGSRVGAWPFAAGRLIIVTGVNKIVPTLEDALKRIGEYVFPLENRRAQLAYGTGSVLGKCVILAHERIEGRITVILVGEALGY